MNLRRQESKYHCSCGHLESRHGSIQGKSMCWGCHDDWSQMQKLGKGNRPRPMHDYEPDNLSYLEMLVKEKEDNEKETVEQNRTDQIIGTQA